MMKSLATVVLAFAASLAVAACTVESAAERPHLVELYTSEGCSSCPPAEAWLSKLKDNDTFVALEYHVDYWDDLGWKDPYSDARFTERQRRLAKRGSRGTVYTPQFAVDGRVWKNWPKGAPPDDVTAAAPALKLEVTRGAELKVAVTSDAPPAGRADVYVALSEDGLKSKVAAGENRGRALEHDFVVRDLVGPLDLPRAEAALKAPSGLDPSRASIVAFVEDAGSGEIVQVLRIPLARCAP